MLWTWRIRAGRGRWLAPLGVLAAVFLALAVSAPGAQARRPLAYHDGLGVITAISQAGEDLDLSFLFGGTNATSFILAVPRQATLSTLDHDQIGRLIALSTLGGVRVHYRILQATPTSLVVTLHSPQPNLVLLLAPGLFRWSPRESARIFTGRPDRVRMGIAFTGGPSQLVASKFLVYA